MKELFLKFLEFERLLPIVLIIIATVCLFLGICDFEAWAISAGSFGGFGIGGLITRKKLIPGSVPGNK